MKQREDAERRFFKQSILFQRGEEEHGGKVARAGSSIPLGWVRAAYPTHGYPRQEVGTTDTAVGVQAGSR